MWKWYVTKYASKDVWFEAGNASVKTTVIFPRRVCSPMFHQWPVFRRPILLMILLVFKGNRFVHRCSSVLFVIVIFVMFPHLYILCFSPTLFNLAFHLRFTEVVHPIIYKLPAKVFIQVFTTPVLADGPVLQRHSYIPSYRTLKRILCLV